MARLARRDRFVETRERADPDHVSLPNSSVKRRRKRRFAASAFQGLR
jgi:hypothetical protein